MELYLGDHVLPRMAKHFEIDEETLNRAMASLKLMNNLSGRIDGKIFIAKNGERFRWDVDQMLIDGKVKIMSITKNGKKATLSGFPMTDFQRKQLDSALSKSNQQWNLWAELPTDLFYKVIKENGIRGKDLISVCVSNPKINEKCNSRNEELFRKLLLEEHNVVSDGNHRENYTKRFENRLFSLRRSDDGRLIQFDMGIANVVHIEDLYNGWAGPRFCVLDGDGTIWDVEYYEYEKRYKILHKANAIQIAVGKGRTIFYLDTERRLWGFVNRGEKSTPKEFKGFKGARSICSSSEYYAYVLDKNGDVWSTSVNSDDREKYYLRNMERLDLGTFTNIKYFSSEGTEFTFIAEDGTLWYGWHSDNPVNTLKQIIGPANCVSTQMGFHNYLCLTENGDLWEFLDDSDFGIKENLIDLGIIARNVKTFRVGEDRYISIIDRNNTLWARESIFAKDTSHPPKYEEVSDKFDLFGIPNVKALFDGLMYTK